MGFYLRLPFHRELFVTCCEDLLSKDDKPLSIERNLLYTDVILSIAGIKFIWSKPNGGYRRQRGRSL